MQSIAIKLYVIKFENKKTRRPRALVQFRNLLINSDRTSTDEMKSLALKIKKINIMKRRTLMIYFLKKFTKTDQIDT